MIAVEVAGDLRKALPTHPRSGHRDPAGIGGRASPVGADQRLGCRVEGPRCCDHGVVDQVVRLERRLRNGRGRLLDAGQALGVAVADVLRDPGGRVCQARPLLGAAYGMDN